MPNSEWRDWKNHVLIKLDEHKEDKREIVQEIKEVRAEVIKLKIQAGIWGGMSALFVSMVSIVVKGYFGK